MSLLGGMASLKAGSEVSYAQATPIVAHSLLLLSADQDTELLVPAPVPCLPAHCHVSHHADNGLKL